ncbi:hypothetical protein A0H81_14692 [Grifola frondosa]|uniref:Uncharacterized protein n=1 Tax=Grifola frondosa TaxID=5627 RepID=A0A1C7LKI1_GRIFR|nr:hypothetical protein A0H81_14692 [Grifola frondosa]
MGEKGFAVQTQNISTVTDSTPETANPFFTVNSNDWSISQILGPSSSTPEVYPRITTDVQNAALSFDLNSTIVFAIYGSMDYNHGSFNVFVTPEAGIDYPLSNQFNASSRWLAMDQLLYLVTGMNASQSYRVDITNGVDGVFDMANVVLYGLPTTTSSTASTSTGTTTATPSITESSGPQSANTSTSHSLKTGAIVGIVAACVGLVLAIIALLIRRRRLRSDEDEFVIQPADFVEVSPFPLSVGSERLARLQNKDQIHPLHQISLNRSRDPSSWKLFDRRLVHTQLDHLLPRHL